MITVKIRIGSRVLERRRRERKKARVKVSTGHQVSVRQKPEALLLHTAIEFIER